MVQALLAELVIAQGLLAREQAEIARRRARQPGATLRADRAIALDGALREIQRRLELHGAAMAASAVSLFHRAFAFQMPIMRPSGSVKRQNLPMPGTFCDSTWILPPAATIFLR